MHSFTFTSESVCAGHPDKVCDQISDAIVDAVLAQDKFGRVAVETMVTTNHVFIVGEITVNGKVDYVKIAKQQIKRLGYTILALHFSEKSIINAFVHEQSSEIAQGVDVDGAGDQGMMFGYACKDTSEYMPLPITLAHRLAEKIDEVRENQTLPYLRPDGKTQVTIEYKNNKPYKVQSLVAAIPHDETVKLSQVKKEIYAYVVQPVLEQYGFAVAETDIIVNGTGVWHISGPASDAGLTGRKIVVDTYGGFARIGGGAFSGKDPTKVDRSGAYAARYIAKHIVAYGLAERAEVALAYVIGGKKPLMLEIETFGTEKKSIKSIKRFAENIIDTSVKGIIKELDLRRPIYLPTAAYGHFGRPEFPWEQIKEI